jgi:hypothetical protein
MATLSVAQLIEITTRSFTRPLHLRDVCKAYNTDALSVRSTISALEAKPVIAYVEVRDASTLTPAADLDELRNIWKASAPSKATLNALSAELERAGAAIVSLSPDWRTVGISGTVGSLSTIYVYSISLSDAGSIASIAGLAAATAAVAGAFFMSVGGLGFMLLGAGLIGVGVGIGIWTLDYLIIGLLYDDGVLTPGVYDFSDEEGMTIEIGDTPPGIDASNPPTIPIDMGELPDEPLPSGPDAPDG